MANGIKIDREHLKLVPVGKSDWEGFSQTNYTVDKTLLIKELIDEYDSPVSSASTYGYYDDMIAFMRTFLSGAMKDNVHVRMGIMTGVLRVAKEGILSGLNNPDVWTVFDEKYNSYFGFTEDEVEEMARYYGAADRMPEIKSWYDGYDFAGAEIYNPWSVLKYFAWSRT